MPEKPQRGGEIGHETDTEIEHGKGREGITYPGGDPGREMPQREDPEINRPVRVPGWTPKR